MSASNPAAHIVLFGRPGSGKSSLAERLAAEFGYALVRPGELLRESVRRHDDLGRRVEGLLSSGDLVPDPLILELLERTLSNPGDKKLIFDGFPRTIGQVAMLEDFERKHQFTIECYLEIRVSLAAAIARMTGRRVCPVCGATYHVQTKPPRKSETCDLDSARLVQRPDDTREVIEQRQRVYEQYAQPVLAYLQTHKPDRFRVVNGEQPIDAVFAEACRVLDLERPAA